VELHEATGNKTMALHVIVIGGGVAGLTAAHELSDRGVAVTVYERRQDWGGKARSQPVPGTGIGGRRPLPGEHGFRFYPSFYKHVIDQMLRIPVGGGGSVADYLKPTTESAVALVDKDTWYRFFRRRPSRPFEILGGLELFFQTLDFGAADLSLFGAKVMQFFTSCDARRLGRYEHQSWWEFLQGDDYSGKFQRQLRAVPRTMVAMDPMRGSARTLGTISMQLILDFASTGMTNDRTMGGPTSEMWIDPWIAHLRSQGVQLHPGVAVDGLDVDAGRISGVRLAGDPVPKVADFYVLAVPVDRAIAMTTAQMGELDPALEALRTSNADDLVSWMVGAQFFLKEDVPLVRGHTFYPDSPWALTSISQAQFWTEGGLFRDRYGDGSVGGVLSVDISDWDRAGRYVPKSAKQCTPAEIRQEVWEELKAALNGHQPGDVVLSDALVHSFHLDADLEYAAGLPPTNHSRLLIHPPGSWAVRPEAATQIPNLVLAGDYVRTNTDLASMEGACEAGRRAVNAILQRAGSTDTPATIWPLTEPASFTPWKQLDAWLYAAGQGHVFELFGIRHAGAAAALLRRFSEMSGLAALDDRIDELRPTEIIKTVRTWLGL
jgi:15-cis-phytoene desaturase